MNCDLQTPSFEILGRCPLAEDPPAQLRTSFALRTSNFELRDPGLKPSGREPLNQLRTSNFKLRTSKCQKASAKDFEVRSLMFEARGSKFEVRTSQFGVGEPRTSTFESRTRQAKSGSQRLRPRSQYSVAGLKRQSPGPKGEASRVLGGPSISEITL